MVHIQIIHTHNSFVNSILIVYVLIVHIMLCYTVYEVNDMQNYDKTIGTRLRALRKEKKMNQTELATLLGKSLRTVQKYENGDIELSLANINDIAKKLDTTATYLLGYQQDETPLTGYLSVLETMFKLEEMADLGFRIEVKRPPKHDKWECSIVFDGKDKNFDLNADMCLFLEDWKERREDEDLQNPSKRYTQWKDQTLAYTVTGDKLAKGQASANTSKAVSVPMDFDFSSDDK